MKKYYYLLMLPMVMYLMACHSDPESSPINNDDVIDYGVNYVTVRMMVDIGTGNVPSGVSSEYDDVLSSTIIQLLMASDSYGIEVSPTSDFSEDNKYFSTNSHVQGRITVTAIDLAPSKTYYYRSYMEMEGIYTYGSTKWFTTGSAGMLEMHATVDPDFEGAQATVSYQHAKNAWVSVAYSSNKSDLENDKFIYANTSDQVRLKPQEGVSQQTTESVTVSVGSLNPGQTYYMRPFLICGGEHFGGDIYSVEPLNIHDYVEVKAEDTGFNTNITIKSSIDKVMPGRKVSFYSQNDRNRREWLSYNSESGLYEVSLDKGNWKNEFNRYIRTMASIASDSYADEASLNTYNRMKAEMDEARSIRVNVEVYAEMENKEWLLYSGDGREGTQVQ